MSQISFEVITANGQGSCKNCGHPIPKGEKVLKASSGSGQYGRSGRLCKDCLIKFYEEIFNRKL